MCLKFSKYFKTFEILIVYCVLDPEEKYSNVTIGREAFPWDCCELHKHQLAASYKVKSLPT